MSDSILEARGISKKFGGFTALNNVSVSFPRGKLTAIIGPNGAGKSTFFNVISGAFFPTEGAVFFEGSDLSSKAPHEYARMGIAKSFQITSVFPELTTQENVRLAVQAKVTRFELFRSRLAFPDTFDRADALLSLVGLGHRRLNRARELAHGEQRSLEVAMALASDPKLLLLDEPTAGMSPEETKEMMRLIEGLAAERTVILVEHKMKLVMGLAQRVIVLHHGELLAEGTPEDIRTNDQVKRVYLGQGLSKAVRSA
jgi:branched-chain amino acid transport system ATP-binding protein